MFRCDKCNEVGQKPNKVVDEYRDKTYKNFLLHKKSKDWKDKRFTKSFYELSKKDIEKLKKKGWKIVKQSVTKGKEIVKEIYLCNECYNQGE